jgi:sortase A
MGTRSRLKGLMLLERTLLVVGVVLVGVYGTASVHSSFFRTFDLWAFDQQMLGRPATMAGYLAHVVHVPSFEDGSLLVNEPPDQEEWSPERIRAYEETEQAKGRTPLLGRLEIPSLDLKVMVHDGTDPWSLNRAVGRIEGTSKPGEPGNLGIAGHRDGFFRSLRHLTPGESITLTTLEGRYEYKVDDIEIVAPDEIEVLEDGSRPSLTLVTCYPFYYVGSAPQRYIVKAELVAAVK